MQELLLLAGVFFIACCFFGKPMKLLTRGVLGLIGSLILIGLVMAGVTIILSVLAVGALCVIGLRHWLATRPRR